MKDIRLKKFYVLHQTILTILEFELLEHNYKQLPQVVKQASHSKDKHFLLFNLKS